MSTKQKMCRVKDLSTWILACLLASLMFTGLPNHFPLLTMPAVILLLAMSTTPDNIEALWTERFHSFTFSILSYTWRVMWFRTACHTVGGFALIIPLPKKLKGRRNWLHYIVYLREQIVYDLCTTKLFKYMYSLTKHVLRKYGRVDIIWLSNERITISERLPWQF